MDPLTETNGREPQEIRRSTFSSLTEKKIQQLSKENNSQMTPKYVEVRGAEARTIC